MDRELNDRAVRSLREMVDANDADFRTAFSLFNGIQFPVAQFPVYWTIKEMLARAGECPSATTKPTEKEVRAALARLLTRPNPPAFFLRLLAAAIDPDGGYGIAQRRIDFQNPTQGHPHAHRDFLIAALLHGALSRAAARKQAFDDVAGLTGVGQRQLERIYKRYGLLVETFETAKMTSETTTDVTTSEATTDVSK